MGGLREDRCINSASTVVYRVAWSDGFFPVIARAVRADARFTIIGPNGCGLSTSIGYRSLAPRGLEDLCQAVSHTLVVNGDW